MRLAPFTMTVALLALAVSCAISCTSSSGGGSTCNDYQPPAGFDTAAPVVSFANDVMPIFGQSCAFSTCHGSSTGPANGVFLGKDAARVYTAIVDVRGDELQTMPFVKAGDPRASYLMRKMDGSQCALDAQCAGGSCQSSMPKNESLLEVAQRDIVRRWIAQGAKQN
jgi:hypothetical protein